MKQHQNEAFVMFLAGAAAGAAMMYVLDPAAGRRRRAIARDKAYSKLHNVEDRVTHKSRDLRNRAMGTVATIKNRFSDDEVDDDILRARVRAELGHVSRHPRAIDIDVKNGYVTLSGNVLQEEVDGICRGVRKVRGVRDVRRNFVPHATAGAVPELQG